MNNKRCFTSKCGTTVFAYFNLVLAVIPSMVSYTVSIVFIKLCVQYDFFIGIVVLCLALLCIAPTIAIIFAIILFVGVRKEKPKFLLAYIIYGNVVILLVMTIVSYALFNGVIDLLVLAGIFLVCAMYSLILFMILNTYWQFQEAKYRSLESISSEKKLLEQKDLWNKIEKPSIHNTQQLFCSP